MQCFVEIDLKGAEWVVTAYLAQDPQMIYVVESGADPHVYTGKLISRASEEFIREDTLAVGHSTDPDEIRLKRKPLLEKWDTTGWYIPRIFSIRQAGKKSNHGLNYNMQYRRFALENEIPETEAKVLVDKYHQAYPGLQRYYKDIEHELQSQGRTLRNCFGQTLKFRDRWGPDLLDSAYAFKPQSTVGYIVKKGWRSIYYDRERLERVIPGPNVHDSILSEHSFDSLEELAEQINLCSEYLATPFTYHNREVVIKREVKIGLCWGEHEMREVALGDDGVDLASLDKSWGEVSVAAMQ